MKFISSDQLSLYYETHGDPNSTPVFLVHGVGADHEMWKPQISSFPEAGYYTIVPDLRGHGVSAVPGTFRIVDCARDIKELLDDLHITQAHLAGVSMGGMVVQQFVALYPERALSQVIVDSLSGVSRPFERFNAGLAAFMLRVFPQKLVAYLIRTSYQRLGHEAVGQYLSERIFQMDPRWLLAARLEVNRFNILSELPNMSLPTLVLVGDAFGKLATNMARTTAENIPDAQFRLLPGGGDPSNLLVPERFDQAVLDFLNQISRARQ